MHLYQFGRIATDLATQKQELQTIGFPIRARNLSKLARMTFALLEPQAHGDVATHEAWANRAVGPETDLNTWLATNRDVIKRDDFYNVALQYLGFQPRVDFDTAHPRTFMRETGLPYQDADINNQDKFVQAIYLLLNTRTANVVTLINALAAKGLLAHLPERFTFFNGKTLPTFNTHQLIREVVWIESDLDTDGDGKRDMLETTIIRPAATNAGTKVPALFTANPYFHGTNDQDVEAATHVPEPTLAVKQPGTQAPATTQDWYPERPDLPHRQAKDVATAGTVYGDEPGIYSLNDYFLARGFATVYSAGIGTRGSDGLRSTGGPDETASAVAIIEWLGGQRQAFTTRTGHTAIKAWWCNGNVAMTGKSYLGTLAVAAATSGTPALKTVISEAAISSWYDYYREQGLVVAPGGFQGEDADVLAIDTYSRQQAPGDAQRVTKQWRNRLDELARRQDRQFGDYNAFWDARNYRHHVAQIKCDFVSVHGLNDWNVKPRNVIKLHEALRAAGSKIHHKIFFHQGQHVYLNNIRSLDFADQMNLWLSNKLLGVDNHAVSVLPDVEIQDNVTAQTWVTTPDFGAGPGVTPKTLPLATTTDQTQSFQDRSTAIFNDQHDDSAGFEQHIIQPQSAYADVRLWLPLLQPDHDVVLEGTGTIYLRVKADAATAIISARLVDVGSAFRLQPTASTVARGNYPLGFDWQYENTLEFAARSHPNDAQLISFSHANLQNPVDGATAIAVSPGQWVDMQLQLQPTRYHLPAGRQLVLIIHGADMAQTIRPTAAPTITVDLSASHLDIPFRTAAQH
ncbi:Xaa-Pro dipeptidyl-peptidase [Lacticaseibacillus thailandensis]|uniref:Xaa-Pro dipeptidyl-peptidase n=1 Tax=Lacticaseibacillus thailandensis DSM 22698 = JCM 13996 TaxID=1423810 RepID=A0A0R2C905_9LACO|nr:Xaa-Pro dipeptidyl-peptidase [Lacticaseibacillus thailandensis]KRM88270.1 hypothetical protein FD19_GL000562 [Lacticaseibacillus thailandensis DSM 22698 = JCM 13996]